MPIRPARPRDAAAAAEVLRRSIRELCEADHRNDPAILDAWLANKTPEVFAEWLADPDNRILVASRHGAILALGAVRKPDEVTLNYVAPEARFRGLSKAMLAAMERALLGAGAARAHLFSTRTAHDFYKAAGYVDLGFTEKFGMGAYEMSKDLQP